MRVTTTFWEIVSIAMALALFSLLIGSPIPLLASALLCTWLLVSQARFVDDIRGLEDTFEVKQHISASTVHVGQEVELSIHYAETSPSRFELQVKPILPNTVRVFKNGESRGHGNTIVARFEVLTPGSVRIPPPRVEVTDTRGLWCSLIRPGEHLDLTVEPIAIDHVHVGFGGDTSSSPFGERRGGWLRNSAIPRNVRPYLPGDPGHWFDWKATARLGEPYVREFESEVGLTTALVVDSRYDEGRERAVPSQWDCTREVGLGLLAIARQLDDPIGLYIVGDEGISAQRPIGVGRDHYDWIRRLLISREATEVCRTSDSSTFSLSEQAARRFSGEDAMSQALQPFARARNPHSVDIESPLVASVRAVSREIPAGGRVVVIASDSRRLELLEAVKEARTQAGDVRVFLLPGVLFDPIEMSSIETRYQDYVEFEEFRSRMNQFDGVTVFEVGPKDRLRTMLSVGSREVAAV